MLIDADKAQEIVRPLKGLNSELKLEPLYL